MQWQKQPQFSRLHRRTDDEPGPGRTMKMVEGSGRKLFFFDCDDDKLISQTFTANSVADFGSIKTSGESLLVDSSSFTAFILCEIEFDDEIGDDDEILKQSGTISAEVRLFRGCSSALSCSASPITAFPKSEVILHEVEFESEGGAPLVGDDDSENLLGLTLASSSYARWFFPNFEPDTYAVGLYVKMESTVEASAGDYDDPATMEIEISLGDHILSVKRVNAVDSGCALVEL